MANTQININANGKTTLATAGKYCDRNIDVNVDVAGKPTQFTNVLKYADSIEINKRWAAAGNSYNTSQPNGCIAVTLNLNNLPDGITLANNTNRFRFRGCSHIDNTFAQSSDGVTYASKSMSCYYTEVDEYGDMVFTRGYITGPYVRFNIGMAVYPTSSNAALADDFDPVVAGCIVTFNEPIGNGGYVG